MLQVDLGWLCSYISSSIYWLMNGYFCPIIFTILLLLSYCSVIVIVIMMLWLGVFSHMQI